MRLKLMLLAALPVLSIAQTQTDCGVMTASQSNTGMPGCGVAPSGYQIQWDWNIKVTCPNQQRNGTSLNNKHRSRVVRLARCALLG